MHLHTPTAPSPLRPLPSPSTLVSLVLFYPPQPVFPAAARGIAAKCSSLPASYPSSGFSRATASGPSAPASSTAPALTCPPSRPSHLHLPIASPVLLPVHCALSAWKAMMCWNDLLSCPPAPGWELLGHWAGLYPILHPWPPDPHFSTSLRLCVSSEGWNDSSLLVNQALRRGSLRHRGLAQIHGNPRGLEIQPRSVACPPMQRWS